jgi:hypothetical protein
MTEQSNIQAAEREIRAALEAPDAMAAMLDAYCARQEAKRLAFVAALIGRVVVGQASKSIPGTQVRVDELPAQKV